jgi:hypothetical protein
VIFLVCSVIIGTSHGTSNTVVVVILIIIIVLLVEDIMQRKAPTTGHSIDQSL